MNLMINISNNFFELEGVLNKSNAGNLEEVLKKGLKRFDKLIVSIEDVESMDRHIVDVLTKLHVDAIDNSKKLSIVGYGCKDLYNHFKTEAAA